MNKKVISAVAAMTLLSTGAFAFESLVDGTIVTSNVKNGITGDWIPQNPTGTNVTKKGPLNYDESGLKTVEQDGTTLAKLKKSTSVRGDALIYPAFSRKPGFNTEIVVRNMKEKRAVVAKVVLYSADATRELVDFNIYLSGADAFRFNINPDGTITTEDDSIIKSGKLPHTVDPKGDDKLTANTYGQKLTISNKTISDKIDVATGYVVVYAMAESAEKDYHNRHAKLAQDYRWLLDEKRKDWRKFTADGANFKNGLMLKATEVAPLVKAQTAKTNANAADYFVDPTKEILSGTVRITRTTKGKELDMLLPATALENYTDNDSLMLWTEGEYAAIQDRRLKADGGKVKYDKAKILEDTEAFVINKGVYTYKKGSANNILFTQPFKRILIQLDNAGDFYKDSSRYGYKNVAWNYKGFELTSAVYDEKEYNYNAPSNDVVGVITSPYNPDSSAAPIFYTEEMQAISDQASFLKDASGKLTTEALPANLQNDPRLDGKYKNENGHAYVTVGTGGKGIPAIATQWVGSVVGENSSQANWIYAPIYNVAP